MASREPSWHDMTELADKLRAFDDRTAAAYSAEVDLLDKKQFIERSYNNVRLTKLGRENCDKGIDIPPSDRQVIRQVEKQDQKRNANVLYVNVNKYYIVNEETKVGLRN